MKTLRESRGIALLYFFRRGWGVSVTPRPHLTPGKDMVPIVKEAGWASGPVWTGAENLAPTGIRSPDRPARRQSLYRLRYPAHSGKIYPHTLDKRCALTLFFGKGGGGREWDEDRFQFCGSIPLFDWLAGKYTYQMPEKGRIPISS